MRDNGVTILPAIVLLIFRHEAQRLSETVEGFLGHVAPYFVRPSAIDLKNSLTFIVYTVARKAPRRIYDLVN